MVVVTHQHQHDGVVFGIRVPFRLLTSVPTVNLASLLGEAVHLTNCTCFFFLFLLVWKSKLQKLYFSSLDLEGYKFRGFLNDLHQSLETAKECLSCMAQPEIWDDLTYFPPPHPQCFHLVWKGIKTGWEGRFESCSRKDLILHGNLQKHWSKSTFLIRLDKNLACQGDREGIDL